MAFHVMNRSANCLTLFSTAADYQAFLQVMIQAAEHVPMRLLSYCVMPTHWHQVLWSRVDGDISMNLQWLTQTHAQRWRTANGTAGRGAVYQGRFRWVPVQSDIHLLRVCRYVERNPVRAGLVARAEQWPWSSLGSKSRRNCARPAMSAWPIARPLKWREIVNEGGTPSELSTLRSCVARSIPYGSPNWQEETARLLRISLTSRGRPKKVATGSFPENILPTPLSRRSPP